ncbi:succinyl-diaminopimelate desuccinylase [Punctularia strigosozonata HHB-11173 SS5]|uniref:Succinyl-diaminopimelate desuccinylase n=1 Tax=Punctularia strigosozonata (strain HHB-11173) TaxID=741275 RepID=R7S1W3_PUNST|nr:succinyl-diaminopimelate desuccinylase [Punctularia strigosozonata HHB-11173 SS5]EIN04400.1 succinyl-diaminopimelate desuccinylase [Punctularia strigosozonata HHB-11173 SS5]
MANTDESKLERIRAASHALLPECIAFLQDLVQIDTTNPPGLNYRRIATVIKDKLDQLGYDETELLEVAQSDLPTLAPHFDGHERVNVLGRLKSKSASPITAAGKNREQVLHFNGHTDVVPIGSRDTWTHDPFGAEIEDGVIYGRGVSDMKGGLAAQIYAVEAVRRAGLTLRGTVEQSGVVDEETTGVRNAGAGWLIEQGYCSADKTDAVIITEPLNVDNLCCGHRGTLWGTITFHGIGAHGAIPQRGVNAVEHAALFVTRCKERFAPLLQGRRDERVIPEEARGSSMTFTTFHGGTNPNSVADRCALSFDRRLVPGETLDGARGAIHALLAELASTVPNFAYEYAETYQTEPVWVDPDQPFCRTMRRAIARAAGAADAGVVCSPGSDDQRFFVRAGIGRTVVYGPGNIRNVHNRDEALLLEDLRQSVEAMAIAACEFLGVDD